MRAQRCGVESDDVTNPTLGQELMNDWLADVFRIEQRKLQFTA